MSQSYKKDLSQKVLVMIVLNEQICTTEILIVVQINMQRDSLSMISPAAQLLSSIFGEEGLPYLNVNLLQYMDAAYMSEQNKTTRKQTEDATKVKKQTREASPVSETDQVSPDIPKDSVNEQPEDSDKSDSQTEDKLGNSASKHHSMTTRPGNKTNSIVKRIQKSQKMISNEAKATKNDGNSSQQNSEDLFDSEGEHINAEVKTLKKRKSSRKVTSKNGDQTNDKPKKVIRRPNKETQSAPIRTSIRRKEKEKRKEEEKKKQERKNKALEEKKKTKISRGNSKQSVNAEGTDKEDNEDLEEEGEDEMTEQEDVDQNVFNGKKKGEEGTKLEETEQPNQTNKAACTWMNQTISNQTAAGFQPANGGQVGLLARSQGFRPVQNQLGVRTQQAPFLNLIELKVKIKKACLTNGINQTQEDSLVFLDQACLHWYKKMLTDLVQLSRVSAASAYITTTKSTPLSLNLVHTNNERMSKPQILPGPIFATITTSNPLLELEFLQRREDQVREKMHALMAEPNEAVAETGEDQRDGKKRRMKRKALDADMIRKKEFHEKKQQLKMQQNKEFQQLNVIDQFMGGTNKNTQEAAMGDFQKPEIPTTKLFKKNFFGSQQQTSMKLTILTSKVVHETRDDVTNKIDKRIRLKDLVAYMQRDKQLSKSEALYRILIQMRQ